MPTPKATTDDAATSGFLTPPPPLLRPRSGGQTGLNGDTDPMRLGRGGVDAMPDGIRQPAQPGNPSGLPGFGTRPGSKRG
jgi:hypothetical protein